MKGNTELISRINQLMEQNLANVFFECIIDEF